MSPAGCNTGPGDLKVIKPMPHGLTLPSRLAGGCQENPKMPETWAHQKSTLTLNAHIAFSWHPPVNRRRGVSRPGNRRNLTRVVRPTRAIGVAAVLALAGH
jgi:hypothetical protein